MGLVLSTLPRVALRLPWANLCSPFGAFGSDTLQVSVQFLPHKNQMSKFQGLSGLSYVLEKLHYVRFGYFANMKFGQMSVLGLDI